MSHFGLLLQHIEYQMVALRMLEGFENRKELFCERCLIELRKTPNRTAKHAKRCLDSWSFVARWAIFGNAPCETSRWRSAFLAKNVGVFAFFFSGR